MQCSEPNNWNNASTRVPPQWHKHSRRNYALDLGSSGRPPRHPAVPLVIWHVVQHALGGNLKTIHGEPFSFDARIRRT